MEEAAPNCAECGNPIDFNTKVTQNLARGGAMYHSPCSVCGLLHDEKGNKAHPAGHNAFYINGEIQLKVNGVEATSICS